MPTLADYPRQILPKVRRRLRKQPAVVLLGPRQVGKTTLAHQVLAEIQGIYLDLESSIDRARLTNPRQFLAANADKLVVLDEIHRMPSLFPELRGLIDEGRRAGKRTGRFLLLGSASMALIKQSGETLAGRVSYLELHGLNVLEVGAAAQTDLWVRGSFPDSFIETAPMDSMLWRDSFIRTYMEKEIPLFADKTYPDFFRKLLTMLAHAQGGQLNVSALSKNLERSRQFVSDAVELLEQLLLIRRLEPWHKNISKRLRKTPKLYVRDSGIVHALLRLPDYNTLAGHPVVGNSWEGFVIEQLMSVMPPMSFANYYATAAGAELDMVIELPGGRSWAVEVKYSSEPKLTKGTYSALEDVQPEKLFVVHSGQHDYPIDDEGTIEAVSLESMCKKLLDAH